MFVESSARYVTESGNGRSGIIDPFHVHRRRLSIPGRSYPPHQVDRARAVPRGANRASTIGFCDPRLPRGDEPAFFTLASMPRPSPMTRTETRVGVRGKPGDCGEYGGNSDGRWRGMIFRSSVSRRVSSKKRGSSCCCHVYGVRVSRRDIYRDQRWMKNGRSSGVRGHRRRRIRLGQSAVQLMNAFRKLALHLYKSSSL